MNNKEKDLVKMLKLIGYNYVAKNANGEIFAFRTKPIMENGLWNESEELALSPLAQNMQLQHDFDLKEGTLMDLNKE